MVSVSALGAITALVVAIGLILKKVPPAYGMIAGALVGGLVGGAGLSETVSLMIGGAQGITTAVMRILAAGVLAGVEAATAPLVAAAEAEGSAPCAWLVSNGGVSKQRRPTRVMGFIIRISCCTLLSAPTPIPLACRADLINTKGSRSSLVGTVDPLT